MKGIPEKDKKKVSSAKEESSPLGKGRVTLADFLNGNPKIGLAYNIAVDDLRSNYSEDGICTGEKRQVSWIRDSVYASLGANRLDKMDKDVVKNMLLSYANEKYQKKDGQIPKKIGSMNQLVDWLKTAGLNLKINKNRMRPVYKGSPGILGHGTCIDTTPLFVSACWDHFQSTNDDGFLEKIYGNAKRALEWTKKQDKDLDNLIEEKRGANWAETILKGGEVLYSNVCYSKAISDLKSMALVLKKDKDVYKYSNLEKTVKENINNHFWDEEKGHYIDWVDQKGRRRETFDSAGNILAGLYVADDQKAIKIENYIIKHKLDEIPVKTNNPKYKRNQVGFLISLTGLNGFNKYHNGCSWPWIGCFDAILKTKIGMQKQAKEELNKLAGQINRYETTAEVFDEKGNMLDCRVNLFGKKVGYTSEKKFAWTAGLYILAVNEYVKSLNKTQKTF